MMVIYKILNTRLLTTVFASLLLIVNLQAQKGIKDNPSTDTILLAAREIINSTKYCALITVDSTGEAHARTMEVYKPEKDFTIWFGTNIKSRKVAEIKYKHNITVHYASTDGSGYVTVYGLAKIVNDADKKSSLWKKEWENYFTDKNDFVLIKLIPEKMEIISYKHKLDGDKETWQAVNYKF